MASPAASEIADGPLLSVVSKRIRALRKKCNRITQMEVSVSQGKILNSEQHELLCSKPAVLAIIDELEKLRTPLSAALQEEVNLAIQSRNQKCSASKNVAEKSGSTDDSMEDLLQLLYFASLFDVKSQSDFTSTMLKNMHERGCCLTYDYVTDVSTDLLGERDLDLISDAGSLMISRPTGSRLSHKIALQHCIQQAKLWLAKSDSTIAANANDTYAGLREKLKKIMDSDYFTATPEIKAPVEVAANCENYASFQVPINGSILPISGSMPVETSIDHTRQKNLEQADSQGNETVVNQTILEHHFQKNEPETETLKEEDQGFQFPRRNYQNQRGGRGGRGGGQRGYYANGSGGRGGGSYQNDCPQQYHDQPENYNPRNYYNNRGRGRSSGGRGRPYNNGSIASHVGYDPSNGRVAL